MEGAVDFPRPRTHGSSSRPFPTNGAARTRLSLKSFGFWYLKNPRAYVTLVKYGFRRKIHGQRPQTSITGSKC
ncbi:unnamed protein product [Citrullus colocynthis]|uniref:Uncharacterized protein n=1 Tax=Citrullus colocynthis TaxID=252529 RepID=A0ABP0Z1I3_9ROSI